LRDLLGDAEAEELLKPRYAIINFVAPIAGPLLSRRSRCATRRTFSRRI